jgi:hypothetical protein
MTTTTDIKKRYFDSLKRGTGEAYLIAMENPAIDFSTYVIKGALRNYAYDGQSESSRAQYIFDLYSLSDKKDKIRKAILNGITTEQEDTWSLTHLFDLAKLFARQGDKEMKNAIYDRFCNNPIEGSDWVGYSEILELDGLQGLIYISEKIGKFIEQNPDDWQDDWILKSFQEENPDLKVNETLENLAKENKYIRIYIENIKRTKAIQEKHKQKQKPIKYNDIVDEVLNSKPYLAFKRRHNLTESEIKTIAQRLTKEKDKKAQEKLLFVFTFCKFPLDSDFILNLAQKKNDYKTRINEFAISSLKFIESDRIRQFGLEKINKSKKKYQFVEILTSNYRAGDYKILTDIVQKSKSEHIIENLARSYVDIFEANKTEECKEPLEALYNKMNCGIHRNDIVRILLENNVISDKIKNEITFDSDLETRKIIKNGR